MIAEQVPLRRLIGKGIAWSTLDVVVGRLGQFVQGLIVARLVAPKEFGVFAIALVVHSVVVNVSELGVSITLIRDDPSRTSVTAPTVATISLLTSGLLAVLMVALAPLLAGGLGSAQAAAPIAVMALNLPLAGLTAVPSAILRRDFRMDRLFWADLVNVVVGGLVVVPLAIAGWGALALAWSWVAGQLCTTVMLLAYRPGRFWPGWRRTELRRLLAFGVPLAGSSLLTFLVLNVDNIIVGHILGAEILGLYVLAFNIAGWPWTIFRAVVRSVSLPGFARLRLEGAAMPQQFLGVLRPIARVTVPICLIIGALGRPLVVTLYGGRWSPAAAALVGLSVMAAGRILLEFASDYQVSLGQTRAVLLSQVAWLITLSAGLLLVTRSHGLAGVGAVQALVAVGVMGPVFGVLLRRAGVSPSAALRGLAPGIGWGLLAAGSAHAVTLLITDPVIGCVVGGLAGVAVAIGPYWPDVVTRAAKIARARRPAPTEVSIAAEPVMTTVAPVWHSARRHGTAAAASVRRQTT